MLAGRPSAVRSTRYSAIRGAVEDPLVALILRMGIGLELYSIKFY